MTHSSRPAATRCASGVATPAPGLPPPPVTQTCVNRNEWPRGGLPSALAFNVDPFLLHFPRLSAHPMRSLATNDVTDARQPIGALRNAHRSILCLAVVFFVLDFNSNDETQCRAQALRIEHETGSRSLLCLKVELNIYGIVVKEVTRLAPAAHPKRVTTLGSPPRCSMFRWTHTSAATRSVRPRLYDRSRSTCARCAAITASCGTHGLVTSSKRRRFYLVLLGFSWNC